ncbi:hypothetical protein ACPCHQ_22225 [Ralstonia thomasii]|uniref:hypothetical protein n=1 Tax=Ralstonia thomasii TaxID=3058596 RepID=UPI003C2E60DC
MSTALFPYLADANNANDSRPTPHQLAKRLNMATADGDMAGAYAIVAPLDDQELQAVLLYAGYSIGYGSRELRSNAQRDIATASRRRTSGFGLRGN